MPKAWMIRAEGGDLIDAFAKGFVALGWEALGDLTTITTRDALREKYSQAFPDSTPGKATNVVSMIDKFRSTLAQGDRAISYNPMKREYLVGTITSDYVYDDKTLPHYPHLRRVKWDGRVGRDRLPIAVRNSLGSTLTLFSIDEDAWAAIAAALTRPTASTETFVDTEKGELEETREDTVAKSHELIKDQVLRLSDSDLELLTASLLRAMGYRTRVTPKGPDRGVDVFASPDGLGFQEPRIKAEVKHRTRTAMGAPDLRSFIGGLRDGERGLYVSTGGFTKEARYEAERSKIPLSLLDLDDLVASIVAHYESFDSDGRALLPLVRVYWPAGSN